MEISEEEEKEKGTKETFEANNGWMFSKIKDRNQAVISEKVQRTPSRINTGRVNNILLNNTCQKSLKEKFKILWTKWKWVFNLSKFVGCSESSA
jgi:hypothetical protein